MLRAIIRKILYRITGINSIGEAINPVTYLDALYFRVVYTCLGGCVWDGKFRGLALQERSGGGSETRPKLFGTYETELDGVWEGSTSSIATVVDIGADDGYYAIGLARMKTNIRTVAVECDSTRCELIRKSIDRNQVSGRVDVVCRRLVVGVDLLRVLDALVAPVLIKCDIEGGEYLLFDAHTLAELFQRRIPMIVETHVDSQSEACLIESMRAGGYVVRTINQDRSKKIKTERMGWFSALGCNLFTRRWTDESRGTQFNRWVVASISPW